MSLEIQAYASDGAGAPITTGTLYANVYGIGDSAGKVWDNTNRQWVAWTDGSESLYEIPLTQQGTSGRYQGDLPSQIIVPGRYPYEVFQMRGSAPLRHGTSADQDPLIAVGVATRAGSSPSDNTEGVSQYALTTLDAQKMYLGFTDTASDSFLIYLINAVSAKIEKICDRQILERQYKSWFLFDKTIVLDQYPVSTIDAIKYGRRNSITFQFAKTGAIRATAAVIPGTGTVDTGDTDETVDGIDSPEAVTPTAAAGFLRLVTVDENGNETRTSLDFQTYKSTKTLVDAINAVSGWTASLQINVPTADLFPFPGTDCLTVPSNLTFADVDETSNISSADYQEGIVYLRQRSYYSQWSFESYSVYTGRYVMETQMQVYIIYTAGYSSIPDDLALVCNELVARAFYESKTDRTLESETIRDYSYKIVDFLKLDDEMRRKLRPYMREPQGGRVR